MNMNQNVFDSKSAAAALRFACILLIGVFAVAIIKLVPDPATETIAIAVVGGALLAGEQAVKTFPVGDAIASAVSTVVAQAPNTAGSTAPVTVNVTTHAAPSTPAATSVDTTTASSASSPVSPETASMFPTSPTGSAPGGSS